MLEMMDGKQTRRVRKQRMTAKICHLSDVTGFKNQLPTATLFFFFSRPASLSTTTALHSPRSHLLTKLLSGNAVAPSQNKLKLPENLDALGQPLESGVSFLHLSHVFLAQVSGVVSKHVRIKLFFQCMRLQLWFVFELPVIVQHCWHLV
jgi:hypothetical protein